MRPAEAKCLGRSVTIVGTGDADRLVGGPTRDVFLTRGGDDQVTNVGDGDRVCTGGGDDRVTTLNGHTDSQVDLGTGSDTFRGATSRLIGGTGDDRLHVREATHVEPGGGRDLIVATPVKDRYSASCVSYARETRGIVANLTRGRVQGQGRDRLRGVQCLYGTRFADRITGSPRDDLLFLCAWMTGAPVDRTHNIVHAMAGDDEVNGCAGGDTVHLGDGTDMFMGGHGDDYAYGGDGPDTIHGTYGSDHLEGGDGNDRVNGTFYCDLGSSAGNGMGDPSPNQVYGGNGNDEVTGDLAADLLDGGPGVDNGYGGPPGREGPDVIISVEQRTSCS
jgi:Ca2+-binding RTX toxin-like protein